MAANARVTRDRIIYGMMMLSMVIGAILAPASARSENMQSSHGSELLVSVDHAAVADHDDDHPPREDGACTVVSHHHCSIALAVDASGQGAPIELRNRATLPGTAAAMISFSQAPPTEPPAA